MDRLTVGKIAKPQGVGGELKISPLTDDVNRFKSLKSVYIDGKAYSVEKARISPNGVFLSLSGICDRNAAELLRNKDVEVDRKDAVSLDKDRYFIVDLISSSVFVGENRIGELVDVLQYGSADVYVIATQKGRAMIPAIKRIIADIDAENKKIILDSQAFDDLVVYEE
ncbi:MAG: ribosome maturation factor RimM [Clostridia bacterium]|nr:ribosome maturation factor RimM [Clostridia bacterium]MDE7328131.1 ribosome maturation factor RimM [Clostridia bacterium]